MPRRNGRRPSPNRPPAASARPKRAPGNGRPADGAGGLSAEAGFNEDRRAPGRGENSQGQQRLSDPEASRAPAALCSAAGGRSEEHTSELQSLMRTAYAVLCMKKKKAR